MKLRIVTLAVILSAALLFTGVGRGIRRTASQVVNAGVIISEVAWSGTEANAADEWIELYNTGEETVDLSGWSLVDSSGDITISLQGFLAPESYYLMERGGDDTISNISADQVYTGGMHNDGESLTLYDAFGAIVDTANAGGGAWPAGNAAPVYASMERTSPAASDSADGWVANNGVTRTGRDAGDNPIQGTPRSANSSWVLNGEDLADLAVTLLAPGSAVAGDRLQLAVSVENAGGAEASGVVVTMTLPAGITYTSDDSGLEPDLSDRNRPEWPVDSLPAESVLSFNVTVEIAPPAGNVRVVELNTSSASAESQYGNNRAEAAISILTANEGTVLIASVLYDGYELNDLDEVVQLFNSSATAVDVGGWLLSDGSQEATLDDPLIIDGHDSIWLARDGEAFMRQFGHAPDTVVTPWPGFANAGDEVILRRADGSEVDSLVYEDGNTAGLSWQGSSVRPYSVFGLFGEEGQILFRRRDERSGLPVPDSNSVADWASFSDPILGRKVQFPGWNMEAFLQPIVDEQLQSVTIAVAPDNVYSAMLEQVQRARQSIWVESLTFENASLGTALADAASRGVEVKVLLEGAPATGIADQERYICQQLEGRGGACWFMIRDDPNRVHDRYRYLHAKFMIVDGARAIISSENLSPSSMPYDDKTDGTWGRRGLVITTESPAIIQRLQEVFTDDFDEAAHQDLFRWQEEHPIYGAPPYGYVPITVTGGTTYTVRYPQPLTFQDVTSASLYQAPENMLRNSDGLLALLRTAGPGDFIRVQQLTERVHWGPSNSDPQQDPNPRLEAYIDAARRGASVRIMLDGYFDRANEPLSNAATCAYIKQVAITEGLRLRCVLANPTGLGIHNKMVLLELNGLGWVLVGSWNGTEQSAKGNREIALLLQSNTAHAYLAELFEYDWPHLNWLPLIANQFRGPRDYPLIGEILYDTSGPDDGEFVELNNPTADSIDLSGWTISDAVSPADFEDARSFPDGTAIAPQQALVVALSAARFEQAFGFLPDFEILNSREDVTDMLDDRRWGDPAAILRLGNGGDEVILRSPQGHVVDVITYGAGSFPGVVGCSLVEATGTVLERIPYWQDSDDCTADFRAWPFPSPGQLP